MVMGHIHFAYAGEVFPGAPWDDSVLVILEWWLRALTGLGAGRSAELVFMDGPARVRLEREQSGDMRATFVMADTEEGQVLTDHKLVLDQVRAAASIVLEFAASHDLVGPDVDALQAAVEQSMSER